MKLTNKEIVLNTELSLAFDKESNEQYVMCWTNKAYLLKAGHEIEDFQEYLDLEDRVLVYKSCCQDIWPLEDFINSKRYLQTEMMFNEHLNFDFAQWNRLNSMEIIAVWLSQFECLMSKETYLSERT